MYFKRFQSFVFFIAIVDILLRILTFIKYNTSLKDVSGLISKYFPENILNIIDKYTKDMGVINTILRWGFLVIMIIFLSYIIKIFCLDQILYKMAFKKVLKLLLFSNSVKFHIR